MTAHKLEILVLDNEDMSIEEIKDCIDSKYLLGVQILSSVTKQIDEWDDDHILNKCDTTKEQIDTWFKI